MHKQQFEVLVIGSGEAGKNLAWAMGKAGKRTAVIERKLIGGSCPNIACLPTKNVIHSAKVAELARREGEFGVMTERLTIDMASVYARKRLRALISNESDEILGFTALGTAAGEVMAVVQTAMLAKLPYTSLRDAILAHPTMAEGLTVLFAAVPDRSRARAAQSV